MLTIKNVVAVIKIKALFFSATLTRYLCITKSLDIFLNSTYAQIQLNSLLENDTNFVS